MVLFQIVYFIMLLQNIICQLIWIKYNIIIPESKFPKGYDNIIGFSDVIENMATNAKLKNINPLDEINNLIINNGVNSIILE